MKKSILGLAALALLASCNNDEELNSLAPEAITFGNPFVDNATRAIAGDDSYSGTGVLNSFQVWGNVMSQNSTALEVFKDNAVSGTVGTGSVWAVNKQEYWIWGATYNFAAVVNADKDNNASVVALGANLLPAKITYTADNENTKDLLYAEALNVTRSAETTDKKVPMQFSHLLSKVKFTAVNETSDTDYKFNIKDITITNSAAKGYYYPQTYTEGDVTTNANTWKIDGTGSTTFGAIDGVVNDGTKYECAKEKLLIPADYTSTKLSVSYTIEWCYKGSVITSASKTSTASVNLQKGYAYNFIIKTGINSPIEFSVESKPGWTENSGGGLEI
jgi:hypothetical protein